MTELEHYGIDGQKWGIRRFQYEDGTLTPEGKIRYSKGFERNFNQNLNQSLKRARKGKLSSDTNRVLKNLDSMVKGKADGEKVTADYCERLVKIARAYTATMIPTSIMASGIRSQEDIMKKFGKTPITLASQAPSYYKSLWELEAMGNELSRNDNDKQTIKARVTKIMNEKTVRDLFAYSSRMNMSTEEIGRVVSTISSLDKQLKNVFETARKEYLDKKRQ